LKKKTKRGRKKSSKNKPKQVPLGDLTNKIGKYSLITRSQPQALCSVDDNSNQSNTINFDIDKEFIIYHQTRTLEEDFSKYWQSYSGQLPILAVFVQHYSIIPASSVSSEAAFSIANYYQRKERSNLSSKSLRYSMILREC